MHPWKSFLNDLAIWAYALIMVFMGVENILHWQQNKNFSVLNDTPFCKGMKLLSPVTEEPQCFEKRSCHKLPKNNIVPKFPINLWCAALLELASLGILIILQLVTQFVCKKCRIMSYVQHLIPAASTLPIKAAIKFVNFCFQSPSYPYTHVQKT